MIETNVHHELYESRCREPEQDWFRAEQDEQDWLRAEQDAQDWLRAQQEMLTQRR